MPQFYGVAWGDDVAVVPKVPHWGPPLPPPPPSMLLLVSSFLSIRCRKYLTVWSLQVSTMS